MSTDTVLDRPTGVSAPRSAPRRRQRSNSRRIVVPVAVGLAVTSFAVSLAVFPAWRAEVLHQAALSVTRQPTDFVEVAFARQGEVVTRSGTALAVRLDIRNQSPTSVAERIQVSVEDRDGTRVGQRDVTLVPGTWQSTSVSVPKVSARWQSVRVRFLTSDLQLEWRRVAGRQEISR